MRKTQADMIDKKAANTEQVMKYAPKILIMKEEGTKPMNDVKEPEINTPAPSEKHEMKRNKIVTTETGVLPTGDTTDNSSEEMLKVYMGTENPEKEVMMNEKKENTN